MRTTQKVLAIVLVVATIALGLPRGVVAQAPARSDVATIAGEAVDAGGRALVGQRVELVQGGTVVQTTTTGARGEWRFTNVRPGEYVVRLAVNGQVTGIRVMVGAGQAIERALIVAPSAAAPSAAFLAGLGLLGTIALVGITAAIVTTIIIVTAS